MASRLPQDYATFLGAIKERVALGRVHAARAVNYDLVLLYWDIGQGIVEKQKSAGWGEAVVERFAKDLRRAFPDMTGFSADNVWRMRQLVVESSTPEFLTEARKRFSLTDLVNQTQGVECRKDDAVLDELPSGYKDLDVVMANQADLVEVVTTLKAILCVKGG